MGRSWRLANISGTCDRLARHLNIASILVASSSLLEVLCGCYLLVQSITVCAES